MRPMPNIDTGLRARHVFPMAHKPPKKLIENILLQRGIANMLAARLPGPGADAFLSSVENELSSSHYRPTRAQVKATMKIVE